MPRRKYYSSAVITFSGFPEHWMIAEFSPERTARSEALWEIGKLFMAGLFIGFLVEKRATCRKSDFRKHRQF